ncbi:MAG: RecQ family ATP-dependent DNA helicase [Bacteroidetes bacterium]|nr:RecQ family ATP-dependent DNA helicase [Bacteroidota bacterium]
MISKISKFDSNILNKTLKQYWGYESFKYPQKEVIEELLKNQDILVRMPTGGGKSICFQLPALLKPGISLVISPLLALIKDQIERLWQQGIKAISISSKMSNREIDIALDNCIYGDIKLLYISPERIESNLFIERFKKMDVNTIAVDEAHCISEWGYDFRPSYLNISKLREIKPQSNLIALTASATKNVKKDIIEKLELKNHKEFNISLERKNIFYQVINTDNKNFDLIRILSDNKNLNDNSFSLSNGCIIIYTNTRKKTFEISQFLKSNNINSDFYHAGLDLKAREQKQKSWIKEKNKIIIATNAFGMGIDKSNVRLVLHYDPPLYLESFYQESGRAGRDNLLSKSILLYNDSDIYEMKNKLIKKYPTLEFIKDIYIKIFNCLNIAIGSGEMTTYSFDLDNFVNKYNLSYIETYNVLKLLESQNLIYFNFKEDKTQDKVKINISPNCLYNYRINNKNHNTILEPLLRIYGGDVFNEYCKISKILIASKSNLQIEEVKRILFQLQKREIIDYKPKINSETITFIHPRIKNLSSYIKIKELKKRKSIDQEKLNAMITFIENNLRCRNQIILEYFDQDAYQKCNLCDNCLKQHDEENNYKDMIYECLKNNKNTLNEIITDINPQEKKLIISDLRDLMKEEKIIFKNSTYFEIKKTI